MTAEELTKALELLRSASRVTVCAHVNPDGDAIGSVLGATLALRAIGIDAIPVLADDDTPPPAYDFLPAYDELTPADHLGTADVLLALDTTDRTRLGLAAPLTDSVRASLSLIECGQSLRIM